MAKATARIPFAAPSSGPGYKLTQKPWTQKDPAKFPDWLKEKGLNALGGDIFLAYEQYKSQCQENGDCIAHMRVHLNDLATPKELRATWGQLGAAKLVTETRKEFIEIEFTSSGSIEFGEIRSAAWSGDAYNEAIEVVNPQITVNGQNVTLPGNFFGVVEVEVYEEYYEYPLTISPRTPTPEQVESDDYIMDQLYASTCFLFCDGKIEKKEVELPEDFGTCSGGFGSTVTTPDDDGEDTTYVDVQFEPFDYCVGDPVPDAQITVEYTDKDGQSVVVTTNAGGTLRLPAGTTFTIAATASGYTPTNEDDLQENDSFTLGSASNE